MISFFVKKLFRRFSYSAIIKTKIGIKPVNQMVKSNWFNEIVIKSVTDLEFNQLVATPDFLKDKYTLVGKNIIEWPHYELIKYLDENLPLDNCDYIKRCQNGTLDFRKKMKISKDSLKKKYLNKLNTMENNEVFSIKVYLLYDNTYIVADGKHSIAMAFYFNYSNIRFDLVQNLFFDTYFRWIFENIKNDSEYTKHNILFLRAYETRKKEINRIIKSGFNK